MHKKFDFKQYQTYRYSWKLLIRFLVYGAVISFLLYNVFLKEIKKAPTQPVNDATTVNDFDVDLTDSTELQLE